MRFGRLVFGAGVLAGALPWAAAAWACVTGPAVNLSTSSAKPGQEVSATLRDFRKADPVRVRWNAVNGPVLATVGHDAEGGPFLGKFTVPASATPGTYVVFFTQSRPDGTVTQMPVRAVLDVTAASGAQPKIGASDTPIEGGRPTGLARGDDGISASSFVLVMLGVAGIAMFLVGMAASSGRANEPPVPRPPEAVPR